MFAPQDEVGGLIAPAPSSVMRDDGEPAAETTSAVDVLLWLNLVVCEKQTHRGKEPGQLHPTSGQLRHDITLQHDIISNAQPFLAEGFGSQAILSTIFTTSRLEGTVPAGRLCLAQRVLHPWRLQHGPPLKNLAMGGGGVTPSAAYFRGCAPLILQQWGGGRKISGELSVNLSYGAACHVKQTAWDVEPNSFLSTRSLEDRG